MDAVPNRRWVVHIRGSVLKNWQQLPYQKLAFHLADSIGPSSVLQPALGMDHRAKSCLQLNISRIRAATWVKINRVLIRWAAG